MKEQSCAMARSVGLNCEDALTHWTIKGLSPLALTSGWGQETGRDLGCAY